MTNDLHEMFRRASDDAPHQAFDLPATVRRGTRLRRRRTILRGLGTLAALAVLGGMGVVGVQTLTPRTPVGQSVAGGPTTGHTPSPSTGTTDTKPPKSEAPPPPATESEPPGAGEAALRTFVRATMGDLLAPYGTTVIGQGYDRTGHTYYTGLVDLTDSHGTTTVSVFVSRGSDPNDPDDRREVHPTSCPAPGAAGTCTTLADGSLLVTGTSSGYAEGDDRNHGEYGNFATLYRTDRVMIMIRSSNGTGEKGRPMRDNPPLSAEQLADLVTDPVWHDAPIPQ